MNRSIFQWIFNCITFEVNHFYSYPLSGAIGRLFWSHKKNVIIGHEILNDGTFFCVLNYINWFHHVLKHVSIASWLKAEFHCTIFWINHWLMSSGLHHVLRQLLPNWGKYCQIEASIAILRQLLPYWGNYCHIEATIATVRQPLPYWDNHPCSWCAKVCVQALLFAIASSFSKLQCLQFLSLFICICFLQFS